MLTFVACSAHCFLRSLHHRFVAWTKPNTTSLMLRMLTDQARSKSELVAENALLRQQLIILRRQVKRPACTKTDRMHLVLLARLGRHLEASAHHSFRKTTLLRWHRQGFQLLWKYKSRTAVHEAGSHQQATRTDVEHVFTGACSADLGLRRVSR